ncbi:MAG: hypothetical protein IVW53_01245 [Chloroflexi bacterium]|nr:hypothetical protein [Chloroflexota bacterium]
MTVAQRARLVLALGLINLVIAAVALALGGLGSPPVHKGTTDLANPTPIVAGLGSRASASPSASPAPPASPIPSESAASTRAASAPTASASPIESASPPASAIPSAEPGGHRPPPTTTSEETPGP